MIVAILLLHQVDIGRGRAVGRRQRVGIERAADLEAGLGGDLLDQPRVGDVLDEDRRSLLLPDLVDQPGDVGGRRLGLGRDALRRAECQAVVVLEIAERVMRGDDDALVRGDRRRSRP